MEKHIYYCDHCGKELDINKDYINRELELVDEFIHVDLCTECYEELKRIMLNYIGRVMLD